MARGKSISSLVGNTFAVCGEDFLRKSCYTFLGRHIKPDQTEIGKFIATLRKEKGLTQEKLGEKLGEEQVDAIISDAVDLCNGLCEEYKGLSEKEKVHTERMIFLFTGIKPEGCDGGIRETTEDAGAFFQESPRILVSPVASPSSFVSTIPGKNLLFCLFRLTGGAKAAIILVARATVASTTFFLGLPALFQARRKR